MVANNVSVVMVSYHTGPSLRVAVESVLAQSGLKELILVDNGNPDDTRTYLQELAEQQKKVTLISGQGNVGFAQGCNLGVEQANGEYLLLLNPDCILKKGSFTPLIKALQSDEEVWAAGAHLINADGSEQRGGRRHLLTPKNAIAESLWLYKWLGQERFNQHKEALPEGPTEVEAISGAFIFTTRDRYDELKGMDADYFLHVEDLDFCRRIHDAGGKILFVPDVQVMHLRSTSDACNYQVEWHKTKGFIHYHKKFYSTPIWLGMTAGLWLRFAVKCLILTLMRVLPEKAGYKDVRRVLALHEYLRRAGEEYAAQDKPPFEGKTVLVTGAASQIGICAVARLLAGGATVLAHYYSSRVYFEHPNLHWIQGDMKKGELPMGDHKPEALIHTAPIWLLKDSLGAIFNARIRRIIAYSSTSVFVKIYSGNRNERAMVKRLEEAELTLAERCQKTHASFTILRPTMIYGLGLDANVTQIADFARRYLCFPLYPPADGRRQPVHADDLAQIALKVLDNSKTHNKSYNIGGGEVLSYQAMVERIFYALGVSPRLIKLKQLPWLLDFVGNWFCRGKVNGEMARRMNTDMFFSDSESRADFRFKPRPFLSNGKQDLGRW
jgi:hypothetical protein